MRKQVRKGSSGMFQIFESSLDVELSVSKYTKTNSVFRRHLIESALKGMHMLEIYVHCVLVTSHIFQIDKLHFLLLLYPNVYLSMNSVTPRL